MHPKTSPHSLPETPLTSILLVDDDGEDADLIREAFGKVGLGEAFRHVQDGELALQYLQGSEEYAQRDQYPLPTLVLLDLQLPKMSGMEVLTWMRKQPQFKTTIVVVLTGLNLDTEIQRAYLLGANSVLFKGSSQAQLEKKVTLLKEYWLGANQQAKAS
jgi:CheY-like chemotaxis protein